MGLHLYSFELQVPELTTPFEPKKRLLFVKYYNFVYTKLVGQL